jgi:hypothetical protein
LKVSSNFENTVNAFSEKIASTEKNDTKASKYMTINETKDRL